MSDHALKYVTRTIGGAEVRFGKITARERAVILRRLKDASREATRRNAKDAGLPAETVYQELQGHDDRPFGEPEFLDFVNTPEGQDELFALAFGKHNEGDPLPVMEEVEAQDRGLIALMCELCNLQLRPVGPQAPDPNALTPGAETTPAETDPLTGQAYGK
jgi:hypothetical protein